MSIFQNWALGPAGGGVSWSSYWATLMPEFDKVYYHWDHFGVDNTRAIKVVQKHKDRQFGTEFHFVKNTDALYEPQSVHYVELVESKNGILATSLFEGNLSAIYNERINRITFNGSRLEIRILTGPSRGIIRAIVYNADFRGYLTNYNNFQFGINADKQNGYYYIVTAAGDYSPLDASMGNLAQYDLIHYVNNAWTIVHKEDYDYYDYDCYKAVGAYEKVVIIDNYIPGSNKVGLMTLPEKNPLSTGYNTYGENNPNDLTYKTFHVFGGVTPNSTYVKEVITDQLFVHHLMSATIKKNGSAQIGQWMPAHMAVNTLTYHVGEDMQNWMDGVEKTGFNVGDQVLTELTEFTMQMVMYGINTASALEELVKVTVDYTINVSGFKCEIEYEALIATLIETGYSFMMPWYSSNMNRLLVEKQEIVLPVDNNQVIVNDGTKAKIALYYNNNVGNDFENIVWGVEINDPEITNRGSLKNCLVSKYELTGGKTYFLAVDNEVFNIGDKWNTEINTRIGYVDDMISKVASKY